MRDPFFALAARLETGLRGDERLLCAFSGERSDFVRLNRGQVGQAGHVAQRVLTLRLLRGRRHASATLDMAGDATDAGRAEQLLGQLRSLLAAIPDDPWLVVNDVPRSTEVVRRGSLPRPDALVPQIVRSAGGRDLVGLYAAGTLARGFANSLGQRNWHEIDCFNFDWSLFDNEGNAVKSGDAGFAWDADAFARRLERADETLGQFRLPRQDVAPGGWRVYLAPRALDELLGLLGWGGFSGRARATCQSPLLRMQHGAMLSPLVTLREHIAGGIAPAFQDDGFVRPPETTLIESGRLADALVSPRTAREFGLEPNAANAAETPESLELAPGTLADADVLRMLDTGLYVSTLWYLNWSDRSAGRATGMTRFATFRVERGRVSGPVRPMRFDDTVFRMLGSELLALGRERVRVFDPSTYGARSTAASHLPGALLGSLRFTL